MSIILRHKNLKNFRTFAVFVCSLLAISFWSLELSASTAMKVGIVYSANQPISMSLTPECAVNGLKYCEIKGRGSAFTSIKHNKIFGRGSNNKKRERHRTLPPNSGFVITNTEGRAIPVFAPELGRNPVDGTYVYWVKAKGFKAISVEGNPLDQHFAPSLKVKPVNNKVNIYEATRHLPDKERLEAMAGLTTAVSKNPETFKNEKDLRAVLNKAMEPENKGSFKIAQKYLTPQGIASLKSSQQPRERQSSYERRGNLGDDKVRGAAGDLKAGAHSGGVLKKPLNSNAPQSRKNGGLSLKTQTPPSGNLPDNIAKNINKIFGSKKETLSKPIAPVEPTKSVKRDLGTESVDGGLKQTKTPVRSVADQGISPKTLSQGVGEVQNALTSSGGIKSYRSKNSSWSRPVNRQPISTSEVYNGSNSGLNTFVSVPKSTLTSLSNRNKKRFRFRLPEGYTRFVKKSRKGKRVSKDIHEMAKFTPREENIKFFPITEKGKCHRHLNSEMGAVQKIENLTDLRAPAKGLCTITESAEKGAFNMVITHCVGNKTVGYGKQKKCFDVTQSNGKAFNEKKHTSFSTVFRFNMNSLQWKTKDLKEKEKLFATFKRRVKNACDGTTFEAKQHIFKANEFSKDISYLSPGKKIAQEKCVKKEDKDNGCKKPGVWTSVPKLNDKNFSFKDIKIGFTFSKNPKVFLSEEENECRVERLGFIHPDSIYVNQSDRELNRYCDGMLDIKKFCKDDYHKEARTLFQKKKSIYENSDIDKVMEFDNKRKDLLLKESQLSQKLITLKKKVNSKGDYADIEKSQGELNKIQKQLDEQNTARNKWLNTAAHKILKSTFLDKWAPLCAKARATSSKEELSKINKRYAKSSMEETMGLKNDIHGTRSCRDKCEAYNKVRREAEDLLKQEINSNQLHCNHLAKIYKKQIKRSESLGNPVEYRQPANSFDGRRPVVY